MDIPPSSEMLEIHIRFFQINPTEKYCIVILSTVMQKIEQYGKHICKQNNTTKSVYSLCYKIWMKKTKNLSATNFSMYFLNTVNCFDKHGSNTLSSKKIFPRFINFEEKSFLQRSSYFQNKINKKIKCNLILSSKVWITTFNQWCLIVFTKGINSPWLNLNHI